MKVGYSPPPRKLTRRGRRQPRPNPRVDGASDELLEAWRVVRKVRDLVSVLDEFGLTRKAELRARRAKRRVASCPRFGALREMKCLVRLPLHLLRLCSIPLTARDRRYPLPSTTSSSLALAFSTRRFVALPPPIPQLDWHPQMCLHLQAPLRTARRIE